MKKALITGIAGQDGSYLAEFLLEKGYEVHGLVLELPNENNLQDFFRINHIFPQIILHQGDITDTKRIREVIAEVKPDEIYDLAAIVDTLVSFDTEFNILHNNMSGVHNILGAIKEYTPKAKFYFASSSLVFGNPAVSPQDENTPKNPITPYGIAKTAGCNLVEMYREAYGIFACFGILFNHESPRRDSKFLPRKIIQAAARIKKGLQQELKLGDLDAMRDWGFAGDYVEAMWLMLQADKPDDYVIGTGEIHSVKDILDIAFKEVGLDWGKYVVVSDEFFRKEGDIPMVADISKIKNKLNWQPKTKIEELIKMMVREDIRIIEEEK
ncbi:MAG: GDP-mannose 4,6-dehydratase [bacterium]|nr:GDP-mannose 4,6-dehydratase [bacterium]